MLVLNSCSLFKRETIAVDTALRIRSCPDTCIYIDYLDFAERVTHKMLNSETLESLKQHKVRVRVGLMKNNSHLNKKNSSAIYESIIESILNSKGLRVMSPSVVSYDYSLYIELSELQKKPPNNKLTSLKLKLSLFTPNGNTIGSWSEIITSY